MARKCIHFMEQELQATEQGSGQPTKSNLVRRILSGWIGEHVPLAPNVVAVDLTCQSWQSLALVVYTAN